MQAPGRCTWEDVRHLFGSYNRFAEFVQDLCFDPLEAEACNDIPIDQASILFSAKGFTPLLLRRDDNEGMIRPVIHSTLGCAAFSAEQQTKRLFAVVAEPSVYQDMPDRLADEAVMETIRQYKYDLIRVLVEVKGTGKFPYDLQPFATFESNCCQLFQQTAMARIDGEWSDNLLIALATYDYWYLF